MLLTSGLLGADEVERVTCNRKKLHSNVVSIVHCTGAQSVVNTLAQIDEDSEENRHAHQ